MRGVPDGVLQQMRLGLTVGRLTCDHEWVDYAHPTERCPKCGTTRRANCKNPDCDCHLSWPEWMRRQRERLATAGFMP